MKKKNLIILLLFPFLLSVFCIITINTTYNRIDVDISYIDWKYNDMEAFQISDTTYPLVASGVNQKYYRVTGSSALVWTVKNKNAANTEPCAEIVKMGNQYYLRAIRAGEVVITCSNEKGNVYRQMTGVIYKDAAILFYPKTAGSQTNIDSTIYYGEYDHRVGTPASIDMTMMIVPASAAQELEVSSSENIRFNQATGVIDIVGTGRADITLSLPSGLADPRSFSFEIVDEGVNVYTYDDLLYCTNRSEHGEIAVLRKSFESLQNAYLLDENGKPIKSGNTYTKRTDNVECFGNYDYKTGKFSFEKEIYSFTTTYNRNFIEQWNAFAKTNPLYSPITDQVRVGLRVQKDFYGNGYTLNLHNLAYPSSYVLMTIDGGEVVRIPQLSSSDLFRGPLKLYSLGDPNNVPLVSLYGQDNIGMYVDGDGITVNDVNIKNCEFGDRLANLATVGTVMEISGRDVTVKNSRISNGKNVMRSFSSMNFMLSNCMVSHSQNFLLLTGSNEYVPVDADAYANFVTLDGKTQSAILESFLSKGGEGDAAINDFLTNFYGTAAERDKMKKTLRSIQDALNKANHLKGNFKGSSTIEDCYFYQSGVAAIGLETQFNGPFLETASPSLISEVFTMLENNGKSLIPYTAKHVSGLSYPVKLDIAGDTRFYDYKIADQIELDGLIEENITSVANSIGVYDVEIDIDTIFPLKSMMLQKAGNLGAVYNNSENGKKYVNIPVAFYGGGLNLSEVTYAGYDNRDQLTVKSNVDLMDSYLNLSGSGGTMGLIKGLILKTVVTVTGFEPFSFQFIENGYWYAETPKVTDLIANAKGE